MMMADEDGQNDIDISRMNTRSSNNVYTMGGSEKLQASLTDLRTSSATSSRGASWTYHPWNSKSMRKDTLVLR